MRDEPLERQIQNVIHKLIYQPWDGIGAATRTGIGALVGADRTGSAGDGAVQLLPALHAGWNQYLLGQRRQAGSLSVQRQNSEPFAVERAQGAKVALIEG